MLPVVAIVAGNIAVAGVAVTRAAADTTTAPSSTSVTVEIIGALAVILVAAIGVIGNYISSRRTAPSPPGTDNHDVAVHDRVTVMEANVSDLRKVINGLTQRMSNLDDKVIPIREVTDAKLADIYRRLDNLEEPRRR